MKLFVPLIIAVMPTFSPSDPDYSQYEDAVLQAVENIDTIPSLCTDAEYAEYEAKGWDAYECDGDKAASLDLVWCEYPDMKWVGEGECPPRRLEMSNPNRYHE